METINSNSINEEKSNYLWYNPFKSTFDKISSDAIHIGQLTKQVALDDKRRIVHSMKVAFAITLVSLFYYYDPLYQGFGVNAMWAVMTVIVVFEFSVGATLGKGVNRVLATIFGGMFGVGAHRLASLSGKNFEPVFIGLFVFVTSGVTTFIRFYPKMKAKFDYGLLIFILTFSLISVSGYRDEEVIDMAQRRITTILIGSATAVIVCILIWPVWAGNDLHKLVVSNLDILADFLHDFGVEYFQVAPTTEDNENAYWNGFKKILDSKSNVDLLVNLASWEPRHGRFKYRHPWTQYQTINDLTRLCACRAEALHHYLYSQIQAPKEVKDKLEDQCMKMSKESSKALKELSLAISSMTQPSKAKPHILNAKQASQDLQIVLKSSTLFSGPTSNNNLNLSNFTPAVTVASLLADTIDIVEEIEEAVDELANLAKFREINNNKEKVKVNVNVDEVATLGTHDLNSMKRRSFKNHVILIDGASPRLSSRLSSFNSQFHDPPTLAIASHTVGVGD